MTKENPNTKRARLRLPDVAIAGSRPENLAQTGKQVLGAGSNPTGPADTTAAQNAPPTVKKAAVHVRRHVLGRNRASPARLFKLNKFIVQAQRDLIIEWGWGAC